MEIHSFKNHLKKVYSQFDQDGILEYIFNLIGVTNKYFVEFGSNGEIFNMPFNITWKQDQNKFEQNTNLKLKKIKLNISNYKKIIEKKEQNKRNINIDRRRIIVLKFDNHFLEMIVFNNNLKGL